MIGACSCWGAQIRACEKGPEELVKGLVFERLKENGISIDEIEMLFPEKCSEDENVPLSQSLLLIRDFNLLLISAIRKAIEKRAFPIVIGGDHSIAVGTWNAFNPPFGLIWIDAHLDAHTPKTSPSGAYHGMPVAALLGRGAPEMAQIVRKDPVLNPRNLAYIGIRSFEKGEENLLNEMGVKVFFMEEVKKKGLKAVLSEAIAHVTQKVSQYGVSFDLDVCDLRQAPGVGSPEPNGIVKEELLPLLHTIGQDPRLIGFELVEYNPKRDIDHRTLELAYEVLYEVMRE